MWTEGFAETKYTGAAMRNYLQNTAGVFVQNTWQPVSKLIIESGLRGDYVVKYGFIALPRLSVLYKASAKLSTRISGGFGYKSPTIFTEESERMQYRNVVSVTPDSNRLERSYGADWDINYRTTFADNKIALTINHLFYYTQLDNPLLLLPSGAGLHRFVNIDGHIDSKGTETNIILGYKDFKLFLGYTYTDAFVHQGTVETNNPLTPQHRINSVLMYEVEKKWKLGLEAYYFSPQELTDGSIGIDYWMTGFMAEHSWKKFSVYINFENFLDARQTKFGPIFTGQVSAPQFKDIYAPLDGFVVNGGIKIKL